MTINEDAPTRAFDAAQLMDKVRSDATGRAGAALLGFVASFFLTLMWFGTMTPVAGASSRTPHVAGSATERLVVRDGTKKRETPSHEPAARKHAPAHQRRAHTADVLSKAL